METTPMITTERNGEPAARSASIGFIDISSIGYTPTDPLSIPTQEPAFTSLRLNADAVVDSIVLPKVVFQEVRESVETALSGAFRSTFHTAGFHVEGGAGYELEVLSVTMERVMVDYHAHAELTPSGLASGPRFSSSTKVHTIEPLQSRATAPEYHGRRP